MHIEFLIGTVRESVHRGDDDLLSAGLGLTGLRGAAAVFADVESPTAAELRRRAIQTSWKGIADLGTLGGYGEVYGDAPNVPGREFQAFATVPGARAPHRVLLQAPDGFDANARCLIVTASSGSRGIYGAIALAGAWGLPRGCAVVYTDKGTGAGYFDLATGTGCALDGTRAVAGETALEFQADGYTAKSIQGCEIAIKHAHSGDNAEADWGRHVLQAAQFGLAMLDRAYPQRAPFTADNTRIIAVGLSNGGGAVLQAAGLDEHGMLDAVLAIAPNVHVPAHLSDSSSRALHDSASLAALLLPCALTDARFDGVPFARVQGSTPPMWSARGRGLRAAGILDANDPATQAAQALQILHESGLNDAVIATAASHVAFDLYRAIAATYASAYTRSPVGRMPCGFRYEAVGPDGHARASTRAERAAWWADASGIPPGAGVMLKDDSAIDAADPTLPGLLGLRDLWTGDTPLAQTLKTSVAQLDARLPRRELPVWLIHGRDDALIPMRYTSGAYVHWLRANDREPAYWPLAHAQHFDAFLALPIFGDRYVPLLPYAYAALDLIHRQLTTGAPLTAREVPQTSQRGSTALTRAQLDLPG